MDPVLPLNPLFPILPSVPTKIIDIYIDQAISITLQIKRYILTYYLINLFYFILPLSFV